MNWGGSHGTNNPNPRLNGTVNALVTVENPQCRQGDGGRGVNSGFGRGGICCGGLPANPCAAAAAGGLGRWKEGPSTVRTNTPHDARDAVTKQSKLSFRASILT